MSADWSVYRATDTRLGREVAVKVLPADFASYKERLRRFEREARAVAALNTFDMLIGGRGGEQYSWVTTLEQGIPPVPLPDVSTGRVPVPRNTFIRSPSATDVDRATVQQAHVAVQQGLPGHLSLEVAYVHTRTDGGYAALNVNHSEPGAGQAGRRYFARAGTAGSSAETWYDESLFSQPTGATLAGFGNSARNQFRSPGAWNVDLSVIRAFGIGRVRPEIRVEATNLFNHTTWSSPVTTFTSPAFLTFTPARANNGPLAATGAGLASTLGPRVVQLGLRVEF